jgi:hypothetical protein
MLAAIERDRLADELVDLCRHRAAAEEVCGGSNGHFLFLLEDWCAPSSVRRPVKSDAR